MISVRNRPSSVNKGTLLFVSIWYAVWVPMCFIVVYMLTKDPSNWFLWIWMIFGSAGLIAVPLSFIDLFTSYHFDQNDSHYIIEVSSPFRRRVIRIIKSDFLGFEYEKDEDGRDQQILYAKYIEDGHVRKISILFWLNNSVKDAIISQLGWNSPNQPLNAGEMQ